ADADCAGLDGDGLGVDQRIVADFHAVDFAVARDRGGHLTDRDRPAGVDAAGLVGPHAAAGDPKAAVRVLDAGLGRAAKRGGSNLAVVGVEIDLVVVVAHRVVG